MVFDKEIASCLFLPLGKLCPGQQQQSLQQNRILHKEWKAAFGSSGTIRNSLCCKMASFCFKIPLNKHCPEALELLCILRMNEGCMSDAAHCILDLAFVHQTLVLGLMVKVIATLTRSRHHLSSSLTLTQVRSHVYIFWNIFITEFW